MNFTLQRVHNFKGELYPEAHGQGDCGLRTHAHTYRGNVDPGLGACTSPRARGSWPCMQSCPEGRLRLSMLGLHHRCYFRRWRAWTTVKSRMKAAGFTQVENRLVLSDLRPGSPQPRLTSKGLLPCSQSETACSTSVFVVATQARRH